MSDLHFSPLPRVAWWQLCNKRLIGYLNWRLKRKFSMQSSTYDFLVKHIKTQNFEHLAISGDLVNLALPAEFENARTKLEALGDPNLVSVVFGNHDAYVPGAFAKACTIFAPWIKGDVAVAGFNSTGKAKSVKGGGYEAENTTDISDFPYMRVRGEVAFIGASSAVATPPFFATGYFGSRQAMRLAAALQQARRRELFRIVMIHHPPLINAAPWQKKLWGIKRFQSVLAEEGAELVLHGHTHLPTLSFLQGRPSAANPQGQVAVIGVSSAAQEFGSSKPPAGYNFFTICKKRQALWQCELRRFAFIDEQKEISCYFRRQLFS